MTIISFIKCHPKFAGTSQAIIPKHAIEENLAILRSLSYENRKSPILKYKKTLDWAILLE